MKLSDKEWRVLNALWVAPEGLALGAVVDALRPDTGWSRSTVLTYLTRMEANAEQINNVHLWFSSRTKMQSRHITLYTAPRRLSRGECPVPWRYTLRSSR